MRHAYQIHELFSIATKISSTYLSHLRLTILPSTRLPTYPPLFPLLHPLNAIFHHVLIPIKASNPQPQQKRQTNVDQKGATLYGATHINMNPSLTPSTTVRQFDSAKFTNRTHHTTATSVTSKIILHLQTYNKLIKPRLTPFVMATLLSPTSILFKLGILSNPYRPTIYLFQTNELPADQLPVTFASTLVNGLY